jgi:flagellar hook-length control protein FliK
VLSVTPETPTLSVPTASPRASRPDPAAVPDDFSALIDSAGAGPRCDDRPTAPAPDRPSAAQRPDDGAAASDRQPGNVISPSRPAESCAAPVVIDSGDAAAGPSKPGAVKPGNPKTAARDAAASEIVAESDLAASTDAVAAPQPVVTPTAAIVPIAVVVAGPAVVVDAVRTPVASDTTAQPLAIAAAAIATTTSTIEASKPVATPVQVATDPATDAAASPAPAVATPASAAPVLANPAAAVCDTAPAAARETIAAPVNPSAANPDAFVQADAGSVAAATPAAIAPKVATKASAARPSDNTAQTDTAGVADDGDPSPVTTSTDTGNKSVAPQRPVTTRNEKPVGLAVEPAKADAPKPDTAAASATADATHERHAPAAVQLQADTADAGQIANALQQPAQPAATSTATSQPGVTASNTAAVPLNGLALQIAVTAQSGKSRFEIRLDPAELGRIDVRIDLDRHGQITSHLTVEKPETLAMLRQDAPQLQRALDNAGFKTGDNGLQFSLRDQSSSGQDRGNEAGRNMQRLIISEDDVIPVTIAGRTYGRMPGSGGGVDIRV